MANEPQAAQVLLVTPADVAGQLYRITAPHFCAGLIVSGSGHVCFTPPILRWMLGHKLSRVERYCTDKRWTLERVPSAANC